MVVHEESDKRGTWQLHGINGWYVGPAINHYQCWRTYITSTRAERIADTVQFFPHGTCMPYISSAEAATRAALQLAEAIKNPAPAAPFAPVDTEQMEAIAKLADIFQVATRPQ